MAVSNESIRFFLRLLKEKHAALITEIDSLLKALVLSDANTKTVQNNSALRAADDLARCLSSNDRPNWLLTLTSYLQWYRDNGNTPEASYTHVKHIISIDQALKEHVWQTSDNDNSYDFEAIYRRFYNESRLQVLFDELVTTIEKIMDSGEIDSKRLSSLLDKLTATIKKNKSNSYFSIMNTWNFIISLLKNYLWEELTNIPALGTLLTALLNTIKEVDSELASIHKQIANDIKSQCDTDFSLLTYESRGLLQLPDPASKVQVIV